MRAHLSLLLVLVLPLLPCFSLFAMVRFSSSPSSILRFQAQLKLGPLLVTLVSGRLTESLESVEDLETGEKGRKVELEEEEGEGRAMMLRKGGGIKEEIVEPVGERIEEVSALNHKLAKIF